MSLPPFQIRGLAQTSFDDELLTATATADLLPVILDKQTQYDTLVANHPATTLSYIDEDDGEIITVGTSSELYDRISELQLAELKPVVFDLLASLRANKADSAEGIKRWREFVERGWKGKGKATLPPRVMVEDVRDETETEEADYAVMERTVIIEATPSEEVKKELEQQQQTQTPLLSAFELELAKLLAPVELPSNDPDEEAPKCPKSPEVKAEPPRHPPTPAEFISQAISAIQTVSRNLNDLRTTLPNRAQPAVANLHSTVHSALANLTAQMQNVALEAAEKARIAAETTRAVDLSEIEAAREKIRELAQVIGQIATQTAEGAGRAAREAVHDVREEVARTRSLVEEGAREVLEGLNGIARDNTPSEPAAAPEMSRSSSIIDHVRDLEQRKAKASGSEEGFKAPASPMPDLQSISPRPVSPSHNPSMPGSYGLSDSILVHDDVSDAGEAPAPKETLCAWPSHPNGAPSSGSYALQDYQMQLMLLEQQNKKRLLMARQEHERTQPQPQPSVEIGGPTGNSMSAHALEDYRMQLSQLEARNQRRIALARQEQDIKNSQSIAPPGPFTPPLPPHECQAPIPHPFTYKENHLSSSPQSPTMFGGAPSRPLPAPPGPFAPYYAPPMAAPPPIEHHRTFWENMDRISNSSNISSATSRRSSNPPDIPSPPRRSSENITIIDGPSPPPTFPLRKASSSSSDSHHSSGSNPLRSRYRLRNSIRRNFQPTEPFSQQAPMRPASYYAPPPPPAPELPPYTLRRARSTMLHHGGYLRRESDESEPPHHRGLGRHRSMMFPPRDRLRREREEDQIHSEPRRGFPWRHHRQQQFNVPELGRMPGGFNDEIPYPPAAPPRPPRPESAEMTQLMDGLNINGSERVEGDGEMQHQPEVEAQREALRYYEDGNRGKRRREEEERRERLDECTARLVEMGFGGGEVGVCRFWAEASGGDLERAVEGIEGIERD